MTKDELLKIIQDMELELAGLKTELNKPEKFEFKYEIGNTFRVGEHRIANYQEGTDIPWLKHFRYRQTESNAQADFQLQKELMCIGALAEQIDPDYKSKVNWDGWTSNFYIYLSTTGGDYVVEKESCIKTLGVIYMPKDVADKVCDILNNKEVEL